MLFYFISDLVVMLLYIASFLCFPLVSGTALFMLILSISKFKKRRKEGKNDTGWLIALIISAILYGANLLVKIILILILGLMFI